ncbi:MAG: ABC transporter permease [Phycisphaerales bacterium]|jgi:ribose/xylose/arabinose/galactoside ABC-type transport system permease subunit
MSETQLVSEQMGMFEPRWRRWLNTLGPLLALLLVYGIFAFIAPRSFRTVTNLEMIAKHTTIVAMAALGMTLVIISGGIDLSVGSIVALSTAVIAKLLQDYGAGPVTAALGGVAAGALVGLVSGTLITSLRVVPFIVTLGMMLVVRGTAKLIGQEQKIDVDTEKLKWLDELMASVPEEQSWMLLPLGVWLLIVMAVAVAVLLRYSRLGRHIFAVGSNEQTARLCGVVVWRVKVMVFMLCGAFAGLAGLMQFSRLTVGDPTVAVGLELDVIAAVVIGGGSLAGGEGSILGTLVGALIMTVIASGCTQMGLPNYWQEMITGAIIIVAVALDRLRHRRAA